LNISVVLRAFPVGFVDVGRSRPRPNRDSRQGGSREPGLSGSNGSGPSSTDVRFFAKKKARLIARGARAYDVHYDRGRLASVSSPLSFSKA
jgi:hypothetical protein